MHEFGTMAIFFAFHRCMIDSMNISIGIITLLVLFLSLNAVGGFSFSLRNARLNHKQMRPNFVAANEEPHVPQVNNDLQQANMASDTSSMNLKQGALSKVWMFFTSTQSVFYSITETVINDPDIANLVAKILSYSFWAFLALVIIGTIGVDTKPLLSLFGVVGVTIGFSAKDFISHSIAGIFILLTRPFERGSTISVGGLKGKVLSIDMRYVRLLSMQDRSEMLVPLSMVYNQVLTIHPDEPAANEEKTS